MAFVLTLTTRFLYFEEQQDISNKYNMNFLAEIKRTFQNWLKEVEFGEVENVFALGCSVSFEL